MCFFVLSLMLNDVIYKKRTVTLCPSCRLNSLSPCVTPLPVNISEHTQTLTRAQLHDGDVLKKYFLKEFTATS